MPTTPSHSDSINQALGLHRAGRFREAEGLYRSVLAARPCEFAALYYLGLLYAQQGQPAAAVPLFRLAVQQEPAFAELHNNLGMALHSLSRYQEALQSYESAIAHNSQYATAYNNLGTTLGVLGRHEEAIAQFEHALRLKPDFVEAINNIGTECYILRRYARAAAYFKSAVSARPDFADAHINLGNALAEQQLFNDALDSYTKASKLRPTSTPLLLLIGDVNRSLRRPQDALRSYERALHQEPRSVECLLKLGNLLQTLNRHTEATAVYRTVLEISPGHAEAQDCLGFAAAELGDADGARQAFEQALESEPGRVKSLFGLAQCSTLTAQDRNFDTMTRLAADAAALGPADQILLHFALAKGYSDLARPEESFAHLLKGNALRRREVDYDEAATLGQFTRLRKTFTQDLMKRFKGCGNPTRKPVFILGMMRSGSTLVEQILASHPHVFAAGERPDFQESVSEVLGTSIDQITDFEAILTPEMLNRMGSLYLDRLRAIEAAENARGHEEACARRVTDKLPANFLYLGLIRLVFPNATIIHTSRDAMDTCLSCFSHLFADKQPHTYDLGELGRYYRAYTQLMTHWREALPGSDFLDVIYESLVGNFDMEAKRLVQYCGLDWDPACLEFYKTDRPIRTASMLQVRRPIYRTSVGHFRPDPQILRPLLAELDLH